MTETTRRNLPRENVDKLIADLVDVPEIEGYPWSELLHVPWQDIVRLEHQLKFDITGIMRDFEDNAGNSLAWRHAASKAMRIKQHQITGVRALRRLRQEEAFTEKGEQLRDTEGLRQLRHLALMVRVWFSATDNADCVLLEREVERALEQIPDDRQIDRDALLTKLREQTT